MGGLWRALPGNGRGGGNSLSHIRIEERRVCPPFFDRHGVEGTLLLDEPTDQRSDDLVRIAKWQTLRNQVVRDVSRQQQAGGGRLGRKSVDRESCEHSPGGV